MWHADDIADCLHAAVIQREQQLREEQAVHGLDALSEVRLHPLLAAGASSAGYGVLTEQPYPRVWSRSTPAKESLPDRRDRQRCDLVLVPRPGQALCDPLAVRKAVARHREEAAGGLFESLATTHDRDVERAASAGVAPEDAYWLEVKLITQHCHTHGVPGPNRAYASELRGALGDVEKLNSDSRISRGGLLIALFSESVAVAEHDLTAITHVCIDRALPIAFPSLRPTAIQDRIGNSNLTLCLIDLRKPPT